MGIILSGTSITETEMLNTIIVKSAERIKGNTREGNCINISCRPGQRRLPQIRCTVRIHKKRSASPYCNNSYSSGHRSHRSFLRNEGPSSAFREQYSHQLTVSLLLCRHPVSSSDCQNQKEYCSSSIARAVLTSINRPTTAPSAPREQ